MFCIIIRQRKEESMKKNLLTKGVMAVVATAIVLSGCGKEASVSEVTIEMETTEATTENEIATETETTLEAETENYTFTDDLGREVTVTSHDRVVTMIGSFTDIWNLAGGEEVVATAKDSWTSFDFGLSDSVINFGSHTEPDVEQIIAAEPDFIIASANTDADLELQETFENAGITVAYFSVSNFDDYLNMLKICTDITGREDLYEKNGSEVASQIEEVKEKVAKKFEDGMEAPTVLFARASASSIKAKGSEGSVGGEILADLGCINIADSDESLLDDLSMEAIIMANPDYIFITTQGTDADAIEANINETLLSNPAWTSLDAVNEGRYYMLEKELYNLKPNARWGEAYEKLADIIYGE
jgi:iron complex transport system substrate-binding protein